MPFKKKELRKEVVDIKMEEYISVGILMQNNDGHIAKCSYVADIIYQSVRDGLVGLSYLQNIPDTFIYIATYCLLLLNSARLRARQKERLARRNVKEISAPFHGMSGPELLPELSPFSSKDGDRQTKLVQHVEEKASIINLDENLSGQTLEGQKRKSESPLRLGKISKHKFCGHSPDIILPSDQLAGTSCTNPVSSCNLLPVLGLYAPNATQMESFQRNISRSYSRQSRRAIRPEFPFHIAPFPGAPNEMEPKDHEPTMSKFEVPDASAEAFPQWLKNSHSDSHIPLSLVLSLSLCLCFSPVSTRAHLVAGFSFGSDEFAPECCSCGLSESSMNFLLLRKNCIPAEDRNIEILERMNSKEKK